ncbi:MAG TPA: type II secretion system protein [Isosphaeraceae bacterium]|jgi:prepilin-type N-terminal cleavage/methylation domain-containing protein|nr:type II secretion system protein [Isosphaeraceae bacterium]
MSPSRRPRRPRTGRGFTLIEMLVVIAIIVLVTAATLPIILPLLDEQEVNQAARMLQAEIYKVRDAAIRGNAPAGVRLLPDQAFQDSANASAISGNPSSGDSGILAASRLIDIQPAPDYAEGMIHIYPKVNANNPIFQSTLWDPWGIGGLNGTFLKITEAKFGTLGVPNPPVSWYWNIRVGEKIRLGDSGRYYTIVGPDFANSPAGLQASGGVVTNPERFVNAQWAFPQLNYHPSPTALEEFLIVANGQDDNGDGYADDGFDGIDNNNFNGPDDPTEWTLPNAPPVPSWVETEQFTSDLITDQINTANPTGPPLIVKEYSYVIARRPVPTEGAQEVALPSNVVVDLTTWNAVFNPTQPTLPQRSRLPVDPLTHYVDILIAPNGQVIPAMVGQDVLPPLNQPFYHFWLCRREDVTGSLFGLVPNSAPLPQNWAPVANPNYSNGVAWLLPFPKGTPGYDLNGSGAPVSPPPAKYLRKDHRIVTLFNRTGLVSTRLVDQFNPLDINLPYRNAQMGVRDEP